MLLQITMDMFHLSQELTAPFLVHRLSPALQLEQHECDGCH